jgi:hypothetical protein
MCGIYLVLNNLNMIQSTAIHFRNVTIKEETIKSLNNKFEAMICPS